VRGSALPRTSDSPAQQRKSSAAASVSSPTELDRKGVAVTSTLVHRNASPFVAGEGAVRPWPDAAWPELEPHSREVDLALAEEELAAEELVLAARFAEACDEDVVAFFRALAGVLAIGLATWIVFGAIALQLYALAAG
jgi:hypothetical protein